MKILKKIASFVLFMQLSFFSTLYAYTLSDWKPFDQVSANANVTLVNDGNYVNIFSLNNISTSQSGGFKLDELNFESKNFSWNMKYTENFVIYIGVETTNGYKYLKYSSANSDGGLSSNYNYIHHGLGTSMKDGLWHTVTRNLQSDLSQYDVGNTVLRIKEFRVLGSGLIYDIKTSTPNQGPIVDAGVDQNVTLNDTVTLIGTATENNGTVVSYEWKEGNSVLATTLSFDYIPTTLGTHVLTLFATDNNAKTGSDSVNVEVKNTIQGCDMSTAITRAELKTKIANGEDVTSVNTCAITDMSRLVSIYLSNDSIDFYSLTAEQRINIENFNQDISGWDVSNVTNMKKMFYRSKAFNQPIGNWDVSNVIDMGGMFFLAEDFNQPIGNWDVSNVTNMSSMFSDTQSFNQAIGNWDVSNVSNMSRMFSGTQSFNQALGNWDVSNVTDMNYMFSYTQSFNQAIGNWDVSNVTNMSGMFSDTRSFNQPIGNWNVSNVTNMSYMFSLAEVFNQPIGNWDVSNVTSMVYMFLATPVFNQPIGNWDVSNVTNMDSMFEYSGPFNQAIGNWDVSNVTSMKSMFWYAQDFNQAIGNWDVSNVTNMSSMFAYTQSFNQAIGNWDVSNVTDMGGMFSGTQSFNQAIGNWDVSNVTGMDYMFWENKSFNQAIQNWDVSNVASYLNFATNSVLQADYNPFN